MWQIEVRHDGLNRYRMIRGSDQWVVEQKAAALRAQWADIWVKQQARSHREQLLFTGKDNAAARTDAAEAAIKVLRSLLADVLARSHVVDWTSLRRTAAFSEATPSPRAAEIAADKPAAPASVHPSIGIVEYLVPALKRRAVAAADVINAQLTENHADDVAAWEKSCAEVQARNAAQTAAHEAEMAAWESRKGAYVAAQAEHNALVDSLSDGAARGDAKAVPTQVNVALSRAGFPDPIGADFEVEYVGSTRSCLIDFVLPSPDDLPTLREVRYVQVRRELVEKHLSEAERGRLYDETLYRAALAILHVAFASDVGGHIERVTLNGWVDYIDKATGLDERSCILSVAANRSDIDRIDFGRVDPKECFKALKGVAASKLVGLAPVAPLQRAMAPDNRFVPSEDVVSQMDAGVNIAAMDWKDFEHLVRQVFENEFANAGAEVRVTQASRDGGVDAIVHDPDPIRGGKIVIQAKRYTNTVDVSAVRDLYGTVVNEGATKGILVTTSQFGPDARRFAQGKPLTLIDGGNFLHLLGRMGVQARIDLKEAKADLARDRDQATELR
jgi:restriction system protein